MILDWPNPSRIKKKGFYQSCHYDQSEFQIFHLTDENLNLAIAQLKHSSILPFNHFRHKIFPCEEWRQMVMHLVCQRGKHSTFRITNKEP
jgi:hypothetical protein